MLGCPACHGRMRFLVAIRFEIPIGAIFERLGLTSRVPPIAVAAEPGDPPHFVVGVLAVGLRGIPWWGGGVYHLKES